MEFDSALFVLDIHELLENQKILFTYFDNHPVLFEHLEWKLGT